MLTSSTPATGIMPKISPITDAKNPKSTTEFDKSLGARLRFVRKLRGLTQTDLARICGLTFQQIQKYESGANRLPISRMMLISGKLDMSPSFFIGDEERKPDPMMQALYDRADIVALVPKLLKARRSVVAALSAVADELSEVKIEREVDADADAKDHRDGQ